MLQRKKTPKLFGQPLCHALCRRPKIIPRAFLRPDSFILKRFALPLQMTCFFTRRCSSCSRGNKCLQSFAFLALRQPCKGTYPDFVFKCTCSSRKFTHKVRYAILYIHQVAVQCQQSNQTTRYSIRSHSPQSARAM